MINYMKLDHKNASIIMDRTFEKNSSIVGSKEYNLLQDCRKDYPNYSVVRKTIKKKASQEHYRGLTYDFMREYIVKNNKEKAEAFEHLVLESKCHSLNHRYPVIKAWFLKEFPELKDHFVLPIEEEKQALTLICGAENEVKDA